MNVALSDASLPVRLRFEQPLTDDELLGFCVVNEPLRVERDSNGELILMSPTWTEGGGRESEVGRNLGNWAYADGRGRYYGSNTGFRLRDTSLRAADAAWLSNERWNAITSEEREGFARVCPEFVIEVRSESDRLEPLREKMRVWVANGAELAWLVDPQRRVVEVYRAGEEAEVHDNPTSVQGSGPVRGFELVMNGVWG